MIFLTVTDPQGNRSRYSIPEEENYHLTIGRSSECDIALTQDNHLSRLHCRISYMQGMLIIRDCGSSNGTYLNGTRIEKDIMLPGRVYSIGRSTITSTDRDMGWQQAPPALQQQPQPAAPQQVPLSAPQPAPVVQQPMVQPLPAAPQPAAPQQAPISAPQPAPVVQQPTVQPLPAAQQPAAPQQVPISAPQPAPVVQQPMVHHLPAAPQPAAPQQVPLPAPQPAPVVQQPAPQPPPTQDPLPVPIVLPYGVAPPGWEQPAPQAPPQPAPQPAPQAAPKAAAPATASAPKRRTTRRAADTAPPAKNRTLKKGAGTPRKIKHAEARKARKPKSCAPHADPNAHRRVRATQQIASERPVSIQQKQEGISGTSIGLPEDFPLSFRLSKSSNAGLSPETRLQFALRAGADCYIYLIQYDSCGGVEIIYPQSTAKHKPVYEGLEVLYPPSGHAAYDFVVEEPLGNDTIIALACTEYIDLAPLHAYALERLGENPAPGQAESRAVRYATKQSRKPLRWSSSVLYLRTEGEDGSGE